MDSHGYILGGHFECKFMRKVALSVLHVNSRAKWTLTLRVNLRSEGLWGQENTPQMHYTCEFTWKAALAFLHVNLRIKWDSYFDCIFTVVPEGRALWKSIGKHFHCIFYAHNTHSIGEHSIGLVYSASP